MGLTFRENLIQMCQTQYFMKRDQPSQQQLKKDEAETALHRYLTTINMTLS